MPGWHYINYNPAVFPNPFDFDPERWDRIEMKTFNPYTFTPFSIGARGCLGQQFALLESKIVLIKFLAKFQMNLREPYELKFKTGSLYAPVNPMRIEVQVLNSE